MPVILRIRGYRFWFYAADLDEPPHVHVAKESIQAKYWVNPVRVARPGRFRAHELREIESILVEYRVFILDVWQQEERKRVGG
jgi:hypothetical protein